MPIITGIKAGSGIAANEKEAIDLKNYISYKRTRIGVQCMEEIN